jgi:hypothetical protein
LALELLFFLPGLFLPEAEIIELEHQLLNKDKHGTKYSDDFNNDKYKITNLFIYLNINIFLEDEYWLEYECK